MNTKKIDTLLIIRGLLAVSVVIWHITAYTNIIPAVISIPGRTAVWFFFGISGYVISYGFLTQRYTLTKKDITHFYWNRFLRIYPLFLLLSLLTILTEYLLTGRQLIHAVDIPSQFFMLQFEHEYVLSGVFWTLGIELQFYLIVPFMMLLFVGRSNYRLWGVIYALTLLWLVVAFYTLGISFDGRNLLSNLSHFFIGIIGCRFVLDKKTVRLNNYTMTGLVLFIIVLTNYLYAHSIRFYWTLGTVLIDIAIFLSIQLHANLKNKPVSENNFFANGFAFLGVISYGVYAWHPYLMKYIPLLENNILVAVIVTVFVSFLSYKLIEQPLMSLKKNKTRIQ